MIIKRLAMLVRATTPLQSFTRALSSATHNGGVPPLVTCPEALQLSSARKCVFVDASYHMNSPRDPYNEYLNCRLPGARFIPIDEISDTSNPLPHMLPSEEDFAMAMDERGIRNDDHVIVYTADGCISGPRVWYMFKAFGHEKVSYLDGGLQAWTTGYRMPTELPTSTAPSFSSSGGSGYVAKLNRKMVASKDDVRQAMETGIAQIADARSFGRWAGEDPEPRAGLLSGHIPGSLSMPFTYFTKSGDNTSMRSPAEIRDTFKDAGLVFGAGTISTCGSGMTAAYAVLGMAMIGKDISTMPIYDGSWTEWGAAEDTPKGGLNYDKNFGEEET